jgi:hypothetical protein
MKMKMLKYLLFLSPFFIMASCDDYYMIGSLNPFYLEENIELLPEIEGNWIAKPYQGEKSNSNQIWKSADSTLTWNIKRKLKNDKKPSNVYSVQLGANRTDSLFYNFEMVVFKLGNEFYADFSPASNLATENSRLAFETNYPVHTLSKRLITK